MSKAATAGTNQRPPGGDMVRAGRLGISVAALAGLLALAVLVTPAGAKQNVHNFNGFLGSVEEPVFTEGRGLAVDQDSGDVLVLDAATGRDEIGRFHPDGTPSNFGALGTHKIDGEVGPDETPQGNLAFSNNQQRDQLAIDDSGTATDGNIYATQSVRGVVSIFSAAGEYLGQLNESTTGGTFGQPCGVAVDANGTVYVGDRGDDEIHVYEPAGSFPTNADNTANFATLTDPCTLAAGVGSTAGFIFVNTSTGGVLSKLDATTGELKYQLATAGQTVTVNPANGNVFAALRTSAEAEFTEFDASGATEATVISSTDPPPESSTVLGLGVNGSSGEIYATYFGTVKVGAFEAPVVTAPDAVTGALSSNTGARATLTGTVNPDGVELDECFFEWGEGDLNARPVYGNTVPCVESPAEIGAGNSPIAVHADISGLRPHGELYDYRLVAKNPSATTGAFNEEFKTPETVFNEAASGITPTGATLNGTVKPDGETLSVCVFEWGQAKEFDEPTQTYPEAAPCVPGAGAITGTSPVAVQADLSALHPGTTYHYRLKVTYPTGEIVTGEQTVTAAGPVIAGTWSEDVVFDEATLKTGVNPKGSATTVRFEYGKTAAYGSQTGELNVGADSSTHELGFFLQDLEPGTTYHYHAVATNGVAVNEGPDRTLTTYEPFAPDTDCPNQANRVGLSANLPNCRAYEMVTPADKDGVDIISKPQLNGYDTGSDQAAVNGDKMAYSAYKPFGDALGSHYSNQFIATRGADGWSTHSINSQQVDSVGIGTSVFSFPPRFWHFSDDLSSAFLMDNADPPLTPDGVPDHYNLYLRDNVSETYEALTTELLAPAALSLGIPVVQGQSEDGAHTLVATGGAFTPEAKGSNTIQLYDYHEGQLNLVNILPGGGVAGKSSAGSPPSIGNTDLELADMSNTISDDGSRIFWSTDFAPAKSNGVSGKIYARIGGETTVAISESVSATNNAVYWTASADGSNVIFSADEELYEFDVDTETPTLIAGEVHPHGGVLGAGEDLSHLYFLSREVLDAGATAGRPNLYLNHEGAKTFIGTLTETDLLGEPGAGLYGTATNAEVMTDFSRATPDGRRLVFQSDASLTGYDNTSVNNGEPAVEVFRYDADMGQLHCLSCNPSGTRPVSRTLFRPQSRGDEPYEELSTHNPVWAAAWLPTARRPTQIPRAIADDGNRVFFNSFDALVPRDTNGAQDVYQWEAQGTGGCDRKGGCLDLISTGQAPRESEFVDADVGGGNVFIRTDSSIHPEDHGQVDIYDAREGGGYSPPPPPPPACVGDGCQSPPAAPLDATPASASFKGAGDPASPRSCSGQARRAVKLSRRAKRLRRAAAGRSGSARRSKRLRRRSVRLAKRAKRHSRAATRCRRANRRAAR